MVFFRIMLLSTYCIFVFTILELVRETASLTLASERENQEGNTVLDLIERIVPKQANQFKVAINSSFSVDGKDSFQLFSSPDTNIIFIKASNGVAASAGFNYYLKYYCQSQVAWGGRQLSLPDMLPPVNQPTKVVFLDRYRYYENVCTFGYTSVWWDWTRWEQAIDWMALNGVNLPLAFVGQEEIWTRVFLSLGLQSLEIDQFFSGPAFLPWNRMGNMQGFGGPLPRSWRRKKLALQHKILSRMRGLGMKAILPAFAGHVPDNITRVFPHVKVSKSPRWGKFNDSYCCVTLVDFDDPLFEKIGRLYLQAQTEEFGTDHLYNCDTFNEMVPQSNSTEYIAESGKAVYRSMLGFDPKAVWVMQGWMFLRGGYWTKDRARALLTSVPRGKMLILDLYAERYPTYVMFDSFFGQPFIWCMLHNFGGTLGLYGSLSNSIKGPFLARRFPNSTMVGLGLTPEGTGQNYVIYEITLEMAWRSEDLDVKKWLRDFAGRRFGSSDCQLREVYEVLGRGVYAAPREYKHLGKIVTGRPNLHFSPTSELWYNPADVFLALNLLLNSSRSRAEGAGISASLLSYDVVDLTRQALQLLAGCFFTQVQTSYSTRSLPHFRLSSALQLHALEALEAILNTHRKFMLGTWIADARADATTDEERALFEFNARNQITIWGPAGNHLDYAGKQWGGVVKDYSMPRWKLFFRYLEEAISSNSTFRRRAFRSEVFSKVEKPFSYYRRTLPNKPVNESIAVAKNIIKTFGRYIFTCFKYDWIS